MRKMREGPSYFHNYDIPIKDNRMQTRDRLIDDRPYKYERYDNRRTIDRRIDGDVNDFASTILRPNPGMMQDYLEKRRNRDRDRARWGNGPQLGKPPMGGWWRPGMRPRPRPGVNPDNLPVPFGTPGMGATPAAGPVATPAAPANNPFDVSTGRAAPTWTAGGLVGKPGTRFPDRNQQPAPNVATAAPAAPAAPAPSKWNLLGRWANWRKPAVQPAAPAAQPGFQQPSTQPAPLYR